MAESDRELVKKTLAGNRDAFGDLVERYNGLVHGVILHKVRRPDEVEDLVQDVFCKAYEDLGNLRDRGKFAPWLARIAVNKAQGWLRQLQTQQTYSHDDRVVGNEIAASERGPDQVLEAHETGGIVWEALDRLPPEYRQVLLLYHFEDCRQEDIARFLNISLPTVKWRLLQARQSLKRKLSEVFALEGRRPTGVGQMRQKVMAGLPLAVLFKSVPRRGWGMEWWSVWGARRFLPLASALTLGLLGALFYEVEAEVERGTQTASKAAGAIHVRLESISTLVRKGVEGARVYPPCSTAHLYRAVERDD